MGEFSSHLFAALAHSQNNGKHKYIEDSDLGAFENREFSTAAIDTISNFKDKLFLIVMMRARNYMLHNQEDSKTRAARYATVDLTLQFSPEGILHEEELKSDFDLKSKDIIPTVLPSVWDTRAENLQALLDEITEDMFLACK